MGRPSRFQIMELKKEQIISAFEIADKKFFTYKEISEILDLNKDNWNLPKKTTVPDFLKFLDEKGIVTYKELNFPHKTIYRFIFKQVSMFELAASLFKGSYLSHHTAVLFHKLTNREIEEIYINKEQGDKGQTTRDLNQANITKAFSNNMRHSNNYAVLEDKKIFLLNGKHTGDIGVEMDQASNIRVSSIARTLIDITVRPMYCEGPEHVLQIFKNAKGRYSVNELSLLLKKINYGYPYHQSIGFYLEKADYPMKDIQDFRSKHKNSDYNFYLTYRMENPLYDQHWRIFYPNSLS